MDETRYTSFGQAVAVRARTGLVGAWGDSAPGTLSAGAAHFISLMTPAEERVSFGSIPDAGQKVVASDRTSNAI